jgi:hypothetical protein
MSRRTAKSSTSISLFPFLAVLVCTMGALILLLLAMTQKIRLQALGKALASIHVASESPQPAAKVAVPPVVSDVDDEVLREREAAWRRQVDEASSQRDRQRVTVAERQRDLAETERKLRESQKRLKQARVRLAALDVEQVELTEDEKKLLAEQEQVGEKVALTQQRLERLKQQQAAAPSKYSLVPYDGASGTTRRPLYVECSGKGLRILPEDEFLGPEELDGFTSNYNPLLAGLRALSDYWATYGGITRSDGGRVEVDQREPYVLLLVRPSGSVSYYVARKMIAGLRIPYGYELIEEDWQVDLPKTDPDAKRVAHAAIVASLGARADVLKRLGSANGGRVASGADATAAAVAAVRGMTPAGEGQGGRPRIDLHVSDSGKVTGPIPGSSPSAGSTARAGLPPLAGSAPIPKADGQLVRRGVGPQGEPVTLSDEFSEEIARLRRQERAGYTESPGVVPENAKPESFVEPRKAKVIDAPGETAAASSAGRSGERSGNSQPAGAAGKPPATAQPEAGQQSAATVQAGVRPAPLPDDDREWRTNRTPGAEHGDESSADSFDDEPRSKQNSGKREVPFKKTWAQRGSRGGIGLEKKFEVQVFADRLIVGNADLVLPAGRGESRDELANDMSQAISILERSWGRPPANFYWIPAVHFVVHPGGNQHYERLHPKLRDWGVYSTAEFDLGEKRR